MPYEYVEQNNSTILNNSNGHKRSSKKSTDNLSIVTTTPGEKKKKKKSKALNNSGHLLPKKSARVKSQEIAEMSLHDSISSDYQPQNMSEHDDKLSTLFNTTGRERNSTGPLKQWLFEHQQHPYPKESDKQMLMEKTKMSLSQITVWFTNARVKMRKENKLPHNAYSKKPKSGDQQQQQQNMDKESSFDELDRSLSNDDGYSISHSLTETNRYQNSERQLANTQIVLAYTCLNLEQMTELERFSTTFLIHLSDVVDEKTTHLITGDEARPLLCPLTIKVFQAISRHLFIITHRWITECLTKNQLVDETIFEIRGDVPYSDYHDGMRTSRLVRYNDDGGLFQNFNFFIECDGCQNKMSKSDLIALIKLCNGNIIDCLPSPLSTSNTTKTTVVLCEKLNCTNNEQLQHYENCKQANIHFLSPEWILESIVHYSIQPYDEYEEKI